VADYFCCMLRRIAGSFAPSVATKRVVRAILKAMQVCSAEPERVVRMLAAKGTSDVPIRRRGTEAVALRAMARVQPGRHAAFYALRLHEPG